MTADFLRALFALLERIEYRFKSRRDERGEWEHMARKARYEHMARVAQRSN